MKPFNLQAALAGAPVVTVSGEPVTGLHRFEGVKGRFHEVFGVHEGEVESWSTEGFFRSSRDPSSLDLRMADENQS